MRMKILTAAAALACSPVYSQTTPTPTPTLDTVTVTAASLPAPLGVSSVDVSAPGMLRPGQDTASFLNDIPGASVVRNGGQTGIAALRGLLGDKVGVRVDGMQITPACPNHMDPPLHYADPLWTERLTALPGIVPVSEGGDQIAGVILADTPLLELSPQGWRRSGAVDAGYGASGGARSLGLKAEASGPQAAVRFQASGLTRSDYDSGRGSVADTGVGSSSHGLFSVATQTGAALWQLDLAADRSRNAGTPTLPMDMVEDDARRINLRGSVPLSGGQALSWQVYRSDITHLMDNYSLRALNPGGMRMQAPAESSDTGAKLVWALPLGPGRLKLGTEYVASALDVFQRNVMNGATQDSFNNATRDRSALFADWWSDQIGPWRYNAGVRAERVQTNADAVSAPAAMGMAQADRNAFNAASRSRSDTLVDVTLLARYQLSGSTTLQAGYARKNHAPGVIERYLWSPMGSSAGLADGRSYLGNLNLQPETANEIDIGADIQAGDFSLKPTLFVNQVSDYITGLPIARNDASGQPVLQFSNVDARLWGGELAWGWKPASGPWSADGFVALTRGKNRTTDDALYRLSPLTGLAGVNWAQGPWALRAETRFAAAQTRVSRLVRQATTPGWGIVNLRAGYALSKTVDLSVGVGNLFDRYYVNAQDGINRVAGGSVPVGAAIPSMGRNVTLALQARF